MQLDEKDRRLLELLAENSRAPFVELAEKLGLSEAAVRRRVKRLVEQGVIKKFTVELAGRSGAYAITLVAVERGASTSELAERISKLEGVERVYEITGQYDIAAFIRGETISNVNTTIDSIRGMENVSNTNTIIILREVG